MAGPLAGTHIIELAGIGPTPFCGMMLADHGAEVVRIDRMGASLQPTNPLLRSRRSISIDVKKTEGIALIRALAKDADGLLEGFRPGVIERLGIGPDILLGENPNLVIGRMTGWGQFGPYALSAGHDINYIALSGALHTCGRAGSRPTPPVNYLGDFGGGGLMLAFGMVSALLAVRNGFPGQVIDCAMTDGSALLTAMTWARYAADDWVDELGVNLLDTGAHFYDTYETADGKWVSIGSIEPQFYAQLRAKTGFDADPDFDDQMNPAKWGRLKQKMKTLFLSKTRTEWCEIMEMTDICFAPVLALSEAPLHAHNVTRGTFVEVAGAIQPAPAPRYSVMANAQPNAAPVVGTDTDRIVESAGFDVAELREKGVVA